MSWSFCACSHTCSAPFLSSKRIAFASPAPFFIPSPNAPPLLDFVLMPDCVALPGNAQGGMFAAL